MTLEMPRITLAQIDEKIQNLERAKASYTCSCTEANALRRVVDDLLQVYQRIRRNMIIEILAERARRENA